LLYDEMLGTGVVYCCMKRW